MLAIRMQRTGRHGHAMFRMIVQDSHRTPTSGKVVAFLGSYDPHTKAVIISKDKVNFYLEHGAQPSTRAARLLKDEGVKLPSWVKLEAKKTGTTRNLEKLRKNRPAEAVKPEVTEPTEVAEPVAQETEAAADEKPTEKVENPTPVEPSEEAPVPEAKTEVVVDVEAADKPTDSK